MDQNIRAENNNNSNSNNNNNKNNNNEINNSTNGGSYINELMSLNEPAKDPYFQSSASQLPMPPAPSSVYYPRGGYPVVVGVPPLIPTTPAYVPVMPRGLPPGLYAMPAVVGYGGYQPMVRSSFLYYLMKLTLIYCGAHKYNIKFLMIYFFSEHYLNIKFFNW